MGAPRNRRPDRPPFPPAEAERLRRDHLEIYNAGARCAFTLSFPGPRTTAGYPVDFFAWRAQRRRAWLAGFDRGFRDHLRFFAEQEEPR